MHKKLRIDPDFKDLIPPLHPDEFVQLEQNILADGKPRDTIKTWHGYIIDGHNRYEICKKHGLMYDTEAIRLSSKEAVMLWIAENQLGRRNLSTLQRVEIAAVKANLLRAKAKEKGEHYNTRKITAELAGVGERTVSRCMKIIKNHPDYKTPVIKTREVKVLYRENDVRFKDTPICHDKILYDIGEVGKVYAFLLTDKGKRGMFLQRLRGHFRALRKVLSPDPDIY